VHAQKYSWKKITKRLLINVGKQICVLKTALVRENKYLLRQLKHCTALQNGHGNMHTIYVPTQWQNQLTKQPGSTAIMSDIY
jgi:hypothetical protein